jgi:hypothetical protein
VSPTVAARGAGSWLTRGIGAAVALLVLLAIGARVVGMVQVGILEGDDFTPYWNGAQAVAAGQSPYAWVAEQRPQEVPDYIYPPLLALLLAPAVPWLDYPAARWAWAALSTHEMVAQRALS